MKNWEYITIYIAVEDGRVDEVNGKPIRKRVEDEEGNVSMDEKYKLYEYLALLGKEGWEVTTSVGNVIVAKRPLV